MQLELEPDLQVVGETGDGASALQMIRELRPEVVVLDVRMKGMDGLTLLEKLESLGSRRPAVVMLSLHDDAITRAHAFAAGARAFVGKHEPGEALLAAIRECGLQAAGGRR